MQSQSHIVGDIRSVVSNLIGAAVGTTEFYCMSPDPNSKGLGTRLTHMVRVWYKIHVYMVQNIATSFLTVVMYGMYTKAVYIHLIMMG